MERFDFCWDTNNGQYPEITMPGMAQDVNGEYVRYGDAAAEISRLAAEVERMKPLLARAATAIKEGIADIGGCDHSVGICCCDLILLCDELNPPAQA